jgi:hypothetical protein
MAPDNEKVKPEKPPNRDHSRLKLKIKDDILRELFESVGALVNGSGPRLMGQHAGCKETRYHPISD